MYSGVDDRESDVQGRSELSVLVIMYADAAYTMKFIDHRSERAKKLIKMPTTLAYRLSNRFDGRNAMA